MIIFINIDKIIFINTTVISRSIYYRPSTGLKACEGRHGDFPRDYSGHSTGKSPTQTPDCPPPPLPPSSPLPLPPPPSLSSPFL